VEKFSCWGKCLQGEGYLVGDSVKGIIAAWLALVSTNISNYAALAPLPDFLQIFG